MKKFLIGVLVVFTLSGPFLGAYTAHGDWDWGGGSGSGDYGWGDSGGYSYFGW